MLAYIYPVMCSFLQLKLPWILMPLTGQAMNLPGIHLSWNRTQTKPSVRESAMQNAHFREIQIRATLSVTKRFIKVLK